jgi:hypothetical protein
MFKSLILICLSSICYYATFAQKTEYANLLIGKWKLDSVVDKNIVTQKTTIRYNTGYTINFEKSGSFISKIVEQGNGPKVKPLANFKSGKWKITLDSTVVINAIYALTAQYIKQLNTKNKTMAVNTNNKIILLKESVLVLESQLESSPQKISIAYYSKMK